MQTKSNISPDLAGIIEPVCAWYRAHRRDLPWRGTKDPYRIWVSEIMLQQTRVEAVKPYYERFLQALPTMEALADCPEDRLLKLWEGLGYYSRVRNMQKAAKILAGAADPVESRAVIAAQAGRENDCDKNKSAAANCFPCSADELRKLPGIGTYTSGAIASIAFDEPVPAADGNVFRILSRVTADPREIDRDAVKKELTAALADAMQQFFAESRAVYVPGDFNQGLMDLGAGVCLPNAEPRCAECPLADLCAAHGAGCEMDFPVRTPKKARRVENRTVLVIRDGERVALVKRPEKGLLAGLYEFPCLPEAEQADLSSIGHNSVLGRTDASEDADCSAKNGRKTSGGQKGAERQKKVMAFVQSAGLEPLQVKKLQSAKHIFSHVEWHMTAYEVRVAALETSPANGWILAEIGEIEKKYPVPSAYAAYAEYLQLHLGPER